MFLTPFLVNALTVSDSLGFYWSSANLQVVTLSILPNDEDGLYNIYVFQPDGSLFQSGSPISFETQDSGLVLGQGKVIIVNTTLVNDCSTYDLCIETSNSAIMKILNYNYTDSLSFVGNSQLNSLAQSISSVSSSMYENFYSWLVLLVGIPLAFVIAYFLLGITAYDKSLRRRVDKAMEKHKELEEKINWEALDKINKGEK